MHKIIAFFILSFFLVACGSGTSTPSAETPSTNVSPDFMQSSIDAFKSADLSNIETIHCTAYQKDPTNAQAAFGCFIVEAAKMLDSSDVDDVLNSLNEPGIRVQENILEKTNPNSFCTRRVQKTQRKYYLKFPNLPFNSYDFGASTLKHFLYQMLRRTQLNVISIERLQNDLMNLNSTLDNLITLLAVPRKAPTFQFTIPKEFCQFSQDIVVRKVDIEGLNGIVGSIKVFINLFNSYSIGLDTGRFTTPLPPPNGINRPAFVADANGMGGDNKKIFELMSGRGDFSSLQPLVQNTVSSLVMLLGSVRSESDSDIFGEILSKSGKYQNLFDDLNKISKDIKDSLDHPGEFRPLTQFGFPMITINVSQFLKTLPDPKKVNASGPFILGVSENIEFKKGFFVPLFSGIAQPNPQYTFYFFWRLAQVRWPFLVLP